MTWKLGNPCPEGRIVEIKLQSMTLKSGDPSAKCRTEQTVTVKSVGRGDPCPKGRKENAVYDFKVRGSMSRR